MTAKASEGAVRAAQEWRKMQAIGEGEEMVLVALINKWAVQPERDRALEEAAQIADKLSAVRGEDAAASTIRKVAETISGAIRALKGGK